MDALRKITSLRVHELDTILKGENEEGEEKENAANDVDNDIGDEGVVIID